MTAAKASVSLLSAKDKYLNYIAAKGLDPVRAPKISKISITVTTGPVDKKDIQKTVDDLTLVATQKALTVLAKKSVASFKLREGMPVGAKVTLRKRKMYEFLDRLVYVALPRVRDFRGLKSSSIDSNFCYSIGLRDWTVFPEVSYNQSLVKQVGIGIAFTIENSNSKEESLELLKLFDLPIN
jgi:large subunit ribosomal protein L5